MILLAIPDAELDAARLFLVEVVVLLLFLSLLLRCQSLLLLANDLPRFLHLFVHESIEALVLSVHPIFSPLPFFLHNRKQIVLLGLLANLVGLLIREVLRFFRL